MISVLLRRTERIDVSGWPFVRKQAWHKDKRYWEVWVSNDGRGWTMLGTELR